MPDPTRGRPALLRARRRQRANLARHASFTASWRPSSTPRHTRAGAHFALRPWMEKPNFRDDEPWKRRERHAGLVVG